MIDVGWGHGHCRTPEALMSTLFQIMVWMHPDDMTGVQSFGTPFVHKRDCGSGVPVSS